MFRWISFQKIGTSTMQSRAIAGVANATYIFALPGSTGACKDGWDDILRQQLDIRFRPCNFAELMPRLNEGKMPRSGWTMLSWRRCARGRPSPRLAPAISGAARHRARRMAMCGSGPRPAGPRRLCLSRRPYGRGAIAAQAEAFRHLAPAGRTPRLHDVLAPRPDCPAVH